MDNAEIKSLLLNENPAFWNVLASRTGEAGFRGTFFLTSLRRKAYVRHLVRLGLLQDKLRLALMGGYSFYPFHDLLEPFLEMEGIPCEFWLGNSDNYTSEIMEDECELQAFSPQVILNRKTSK